ncbi:hypothetical protein MNBD_NITROSPIRAE01-1780 [hydrothermal vent metagenome]|uniref:Translocation and assembly module TamB C-terminal domain-containing protein n=1 Tax=hydrothermal vent metagenome TaxID=652676 RepID=A0A3B1C682_9ZZZZ
MSKKWVFSIFFVLLALTVSVHFFLQSPFFSKKIVGFVETTLEKSLGKKVQVSHAQLDILSASLSLEGLSVQRNLNDQNPLLFTKSLRVFFDITSLFTEVLVIRKVTIDAPEIVLTDALIAEISALKKSLPGNKSEIKNPSTPALVLRKIQINSGEISYIGEGTLKGASLSGLALEINPDLNMRHFELGLIAKAGTFSTQGFNKKIDQFEVEIEVNNNKISLKKGKISSGKTELSTHGTIDFSQEKPFSIVVDLRLPLDSELTSVLGPGIEKYLSTQAFSGDLIFSGQMTGTIPDLMFEGTLALPSLSAQQEKIGTLETKLVYDRNQVTLSDISGTLFSGTFSGALKTTLPGQNLEIEGEVTPGLQAALQYNNLPADRLTEILPLFYDKETMPSLKGLFLSGAVNLSLPKMRVQDLQAQGTVSSQRLPLFAPPLSKDAKVLQKTVALFKTGKIRWLWSSGGLVINQATLDFPDLQLALHGQWHPSKGYAFETALVSREIEEVAHTLHLPLTGRLHVNGLLSKYQDAPAFEGILLAESGTLKGQSFHSFISEITLQNKTLAIKKAVLNIPAKNEIKKFPSPAGLYTATGLIHFDLPKQPRFDVKVEVKDGNPQEVFRFLNLKIPLYTRANGTVLIQGEPKSFFVKGPLTLSRGSLYGETFDQGSLDLTVTEKEVLFENVILVHKKSILSGKGGIAYNETYWFSLKGDHLQVQDTAFLHWMPQSLRAQLGLVVSGRGSFLEPQLRFIVAVKNLSYGDLQGVRGTIKADWVNRTVDFEATFPKNKISASGTVQLKPSYPFSFNSEFFAFQIDPLFRGRGTGPMEDMQVRASGKLRGSGLLFDWERLNLSGHLDTVTADFGGYRLENSGRLPILARNGIFVFQNARFKGENTELALNGNLKVLKKWNLFLKGEADLNLVTFFSKKIASGKGTAHLDLAVSDAWFSPQLRGELSINAGKFRTASLSQSIEVTDLSILFNERQLILENLQGRIGGGNFHATGQAGLSGFKVNDFGFLLELGKVRLDLAKNLPATISGELFFQKKALEQTLKGDLRIKNVTYEKKMNLRQFVLDFTKKNRNDLSEETPIIGRTKINIHLFGDKELWIANNLAKIPLAVDLLLKGSFDQPRLLGRIDIAGGDIYFRHNTFKIVSGAVNFLNPEEIDPNFELTARTDVRNISTDRIYTIDLNLAGTLSQVTLTWNAFPSLSDTDILSLLAIRKTTADLALGKRRGAGTEATNFIVTEFLAEPVDQITGIVGEPVEQITGIDNIRVEPSIGGTNASATVGTRLTAEKRLMNDRLVVIYTTTLDASEEEVIRMVYEVNKHISLVGKREEDGQLGGDIRFRFEIR